MYWNYRFIHSSWWKNNETNCLMRCTSKSYQISTRCNKASLFICRKTSLCTCGSGSLICHFSFLCRFLKNMSNNRLALTLWSWRPMGNPGFATTDGHFFCLLFLFYRNWDTYKCLQKLPPFPTKTTTQNRIKYRIEGTRWLVLSHQ